MLRVVKLSRLQEAKRYRANAAASGEPTLEGPVVEEIAMKLAQVQEKNEALNSEKLRLEGYLRTAKKVCLVPQPTRCWSTSAIPPPSLFSHHSNHQSVQMIRELRQQKKDEADAETAVRVPSFALFNPRATARTHC